MEHRCRDHEKRTVEKSILRSRKHVRQPYLPPRPNMPLFDVCGHSGERRSGRDMLRRVAAHGEMPRNRTISKGNHCVPTTVIDGAPYAPPHPADDTPHSRPLIEGTDSDTDCVDYRPERRRGRYEPCTRTRMGFDASPCSSYSPGCFFLSCLAALTWSSSARCTRGWRTTFQW